MGFFSVDDFSLKTEFNLNELIAVGIPLTFTITDNDLEMEKTVSAVNANVSISGDTITYTPTSAGEGILIFNDNSYNFTHILPGQAEFTTPVTAAGSPYTVISSVGAYIEENTAASIAQNSFTISQAAFRISVAIELSP